MKLVGLIERVLCAITPFIEFEQPHNFSWTCLWFVNLFFLSLSPCWIHVQLISCNIAEDAVRMFFIPYISHSPFISLFFDVIPICKLQSWFSISLRINIIIMESERKLIVYCYNSCINCYLDMVNCHKMSGFASISCLT